MTRRPLGSLGAAKSFKMDDMQMTARFAELGCRSIQRSPTAMRRPPLVRHYGWIDSEWPCGRRPRHRSPESTLERTHRKSEAVARAIAHPQGNTEGNLVGR